MKGKCCLCVALLAAALTGCRGLSRQESATNTVDGGAAGPLKAQQIADVQIALAKTIDSRGDGQQAMAFYAEAVRKDPTRADAWSRLAVLADREGMFAESSEYYRRAIELQPNNPDLACNLGYSLYLQQRWGEAEGALRRAVALKPEHQRAQNNLGLVLARAGKTDDALECFQRAGCPKADAHVNLAYALTLNGDFAGARREYEVARSDDPSSEAAKKGLTRLNALAAKLNQTSNAPGAGSELVPAGGVTVPPVPNR